MDERIQSWNNTSNLFHVVFKYSLFNNYCVEIKLIRRRVVLKLNKPSLFNQNI